VTKKESKNNKGDTFEWDETPEVLEALKVLQDLERKHAESNGDYGVGK
tara:strand:- start:84 stop:227 length:144 start_codon:yes stop_codon:yes gene_type:complete